MSNKLLKNIFSVTNDNNKTHKVLKFLGLKFKFKNKEHKLDEILTTLEITNKNLRIDIVDIIATSRIQEETFKKYKNCNYGKNVVLLAPGPSLNYYKSINNTLHIGLNRTVYREDIDFDYFFMQDYIAVKDYIDKLGEERFKETKKFFGIMKDFTYEGKASIPESISNRLGAERYCIFHHWNYFNNIFPRDIAYSPLATASTVAGSAIQFALYTNPKKIYLVGCDCSFNYFNEKSQKMNLNNFVYNSWIDTKQFAEIWYPETEIISINPVGLKGIFKDVYTESYLAEHPEIREELGENIEILPTKEMESV